MKNTDLKRARDLALYREFKRMLAENGFPTMRTAASAVCRRPSPRFFIEPERASLLVGCIINGISLAKHNPATQRMARQLHANYEQYLKDNPGCRLSRERIMEILVEQPAPEFYIGAQSARKIIYRERKKARARWERWREI